MLAKFRAFTQEPIKIERIVKIVAPVATPARPVLQEAPQIGWTEAEL